MHHLNVAIFLTVHCSKKVDSLPVVAPKRDLSKQIILIPRRVSFLLAVVAKMRSLIFSSAGKVGGGGGGDVSSRG